MTDPVPPAVRRLLDAADETIALAQEMQRRGRHADALACALFANEYVRAARAIAGIGKSAA